MGNAIFPVLPGLKWDIAKSPAFSTLIRQSVSGLETRIGQRPYPLRKWTLSYELLRSGAQQELQTIESFFLARQGKFDSFLFDDSYTPDDSVTGQAIGTGDAATTEFQLQRAYPFGGFVEPVLAPNSLNVYLNGVAQSPSTYAVSTWGASATPGIVTFTAAPGTGVAITADIGFYWPLRFDTDAAEFNDFMYQLWELKSIDLVQVMN